MEHFFNTKILFKNADLPQKIPTYFICDYTNASICFETFSTSLLVQKQS